MVFFKYLKMLIKTLIKCFEWYLSQGNRYIDLNCVFTKKNHRNGLNIKQEYVEEIEERNQEVVTGVT